MKYISLSVLISLFLFSCAPEGKEETTDEKTPVVEMSYHGEKITPENAVNFTSFEGEKAEGVKLSGSIDKVCQAKGCWMTLKGDDGKEMRVTFKDYGFFVPKDASGKTAIVEGNMKVDTTSVEDLIHYAIDGGMSEKEAEEKYTEPEMTLSFVASGVIIK
ncbi:MAG: DUF4920 domain-containing protein [Bacteroidia bacterium]|nr:DUF4920 domain-containing protein [Bacteroidia bacterium]